MLLFLNLGLSQDYSKELFVQNNDTLPYRMLLPKDYSPLKQYPMIIFLHGSGERGRDNEAQLVHGDWLFKTTDFKNPVSLFTLRDILEFEFNFLFN